MSHLPGTSGTNNNNTNMNTNAGGDDVDTHDGSGSGGRCRRHGQSVVYNRKGNENNNAVSKNDVEVEQTTECRGKLGGRGGRAKNWTNIV